MRNVNGCHVDALIEGSAGDAVHPVSHVTTCHCLGYGDFTRILLAATGDFRRQRVSIEVIINTVNLRLRPQRTETAETEERQAQSEPPKGR